MFHKSLLFDLGEKNEVLDDFDYREFLREWIEIWWSYFSNIKFLSQHEGYFN